MEQPSASAVVFVAHRFQNRIQSVNRLLDDIILRLHLREKPDDIGEGFQTEHPVNSLEYFYDYCTYCMKQLLTLADHPESTFSIINLVAVYWLENEKLTNLKSEELTALLRAILRIQDDAQCVPFLYDKLGTVLAARLSEEEGSEVALQQMQQIAEMHFRELGAEHSACADSAWLLAENFRERARVQSATHWYEIALIGFKRNFGTLSPRTRECMEKLASSYQDLGFYDMAKACLENLIELNEDQYGHHHLETLNMMSRLARCYMSNKQFTLAGHWLEDLHSRCIEALGPSHSSTIASLVDLGRCRLGQGDYKASEIFLLNALNSTCRTSQSHDADRINVYVHLARCYGLMNKVVRADEYFHRALALSQQVLGVFHTETLDCVEAMASYYRGRHDFERAEELYLYALAIAEGSLRKQVVRVTAIRQRLSALYMEQEKYALAELVLAGAMQHLHSQDIQTAELNTHLVADYLAILRQQGKYRDTLVSLVDFLERTTQKFGHKHPQSLASFEALLDCVAEVAKDIQAVDSHDRSAYQEDFVLLQALANAMDENIAEHVATLYRDL